MSQETSLLFTDMVAAAEEYCRLIDSVEKFSREKWLHSMSSLLPRLHAAISVLDVELKSREHTIDSDYDERFALFSHLYMMLGERDGYWMEFDTANDGQRLSGSLADDFTDIYFDLKHGLEMLQEQPSAGEKAVSDWRYSFDKHWGQHLVDAERQLYHLSAQQQLDH
ncbi:MAG: DUF5063 domain-containing protein [Gammaproteobacteria bacterium]|nr:DUF5063 domain-containing protein [Gammaproteobacteria bacterium]